MVVRAVAFSWARVEALEVAASALAMSFLSSAEALVASACFAVISESLSASLRSRAAREVVARAALVLASLAARSALAMEASALRRAASADEYIRAATAAMARPATAGSHWMGREACCSC